MRKVRESTLKVSETYGAWARLCHYEKQKKKSTMGASDAHDAKKAARTYCVNIAIRGKEIYPQVGEGCGI